MKKVIIILLVLMFFVPVMAFSTSNSYFQVSSLIDAGLLKNNDLIASMATELTPVETSTLYSANKKGAGLPFALNLFLGIGIGSFVQGDVGGGVTALCGELGSLTMVLIGSSMTASAIANSSYTYQNGTYVTTSNSSQSDMGTTLTAIGAIGYFAFRIYELIKPFTYASNYNKTLMSSLNGAYSTTISVVPTINSQNEMGVTAVAKVSF